MPIDSMSSAGAIEEAVVGVGETDVPRRTLSAADEQSVLEQEILALRESVAAYDDVAPDRAAAARAGIELLTTLR